MSNIAVYENEYIQAITCVEDMPAVAADIVRSYCEKNDIDEKDIYPSIWNDIITELYVNLFCPCKRILKKDNPRYNDYDVQKVEYVYNNIYKRLCNRHCQEVSIKGFTDMTGIGKQTLYDWENGALSSQRSDLHKNIMEDNEESLFALMRDRRYNPMKLLPKLNKVHNWNMPGVSREGSQRAIKSADQLPKLGEINTQLADVQGENSQQNCVKIDTI